MSNNRGGFFSLNRLLGRKPKSGKISSNELSKSSSVQILTRSTTNLEELSPQNKITPLAAVHNAPFEQTFRVTVYLPLGQLYVARIGAKTKLSELLDTICLNKLLDPSKFEFRHPTDDSQVFDLSFTIGEVGLSEIKLALNSSKDETSVRYRMPINSQQNRSVRPHTMSTVSPYSSINSLNSSDSIGAMMGQRSSYHIPAIPVRKKRVAPRPPSQNSISEDPEQKLVETENMTQPNLDKVLIRQHFHMSSPNLTSNKIISKPQHSTEKTVESYVHYKQTINGSNPETKSIPFNRPLSIQLNNTSSEDQSLNCKRIGTPHLMNCQNHSRASSETSDITADINYPEPQPRKIIGRKRAPAPPPRTVSTASSNRPIATPIQNIKEVGMKNEQLCLQATSKTKEKAETNSESPKSCKSTNISKVMLNVCEMEPSFQNELVNDRKEIHEHKKEENIHGKDSMQIVPKVQVNYPLKNEHCVIDSKPKQMSVVNFNGSIEIDQNDVSKQVNEIIDEAVRINEAKLNSAYFNEINNNNEISYDSEKTKYNHFKSEVPIHPILNETRTFDFHEVSYNSLPISTSSTLNTTETISTGPESLITSDIEDGYKGNDLENKRKMEIECEDSKEDFIESQFGFLSEHSDDEKSVENRRCKIISSTMITEKCNEKYDTTIFEEKRGVINELTQMINNKGLETFIKPSNGASNHVEMSNECSLANFQIGAYTCNQTKTIDSTTDSGPKNVIGNVEENGETFIISKPIARSVSFHSTLASVEDNQTSKSNVADGLFGTPRSASNISLNCISRFEKQSKNELVLQKKSSSELSIADTPSLQSLEIMKSILSHSRTMNKNCKSAIQETKEFDEPDEPKDEENSQRKSQLNKQQLQSVDILKPISKPKTWTYQGPPSVNVSTWKERPKSSVSIKSDNDYIFGGISKMVALQKQFSGENVNKVNRYSDTPETLETPENCDNQTCKLPIVRSVEYKKNILNSPVENESESIKTFNLARPSYEISRIVSEKLHSEKIVNSQRETILSQLQSNRNINSDPAKAFNSKPSLFNNKSNINTEAHKVCSTGEKFEKPAEKPIFSQFSLRKTGLKEKILDECNSSKNLISNDNDNRNIRNELTQVKINNIAPKPPPMPKKTFTRPVLTVAIKPDPRNELLNSIQNFNRKTLKRNHIN